jgi:restriction system protein
MPPVDGTDWKDLRQPLLKMAADGKEHSLDSACEVLGKPLHFTDAELANRKAGSRYHQFRAQVGQAKAHLIKGGYLDAPTKRRFRISPKGIKALTEGFPSDEATSAATARVVTAAIPAVPPVISTKDPVLLPPVVKPVIPKSRTQEAKASPESLAEMHRQLQSRLAAELLNRVKQASPSFFEALVLNLLAAMGYAAAKDAIEHTGGSGDGGIDGIVREDRLGLSRIYVQAKRRAGSTPVGIRDIQQFNGALDRKNATKGVYLTTGRFTEEARVEAESSSRRIALVDGERLVALMIEFGIGVRIRETFVVKEIDPAYFAEEQSDEAFKKKQACTAAASS